jgi:glutathione synthase/RimK-type ligase-like ATP-grasp enzyme
MKNKKIAYLTDSLTSMDLSAGDDKLISNLEKKLKIDIVPWETAVNWSEYDLVMIRTTWDYMPKTQKYLNVLESISQQTKLINPIETVKWNINKKYLLELCELGFPIIPTSLESKVTKDNIVPLFERFDKGQGIIIKPTIGASSDGIQFLKTPQELQELTTGEWFVQSFQKSIQLQGEFSLFFFNGHYSHAVNKMPKAGEFRSQEEFDSTVTNIQPSEQMRSLGEKVLAKIPVITEYARIDLILSDKDQPQIVELELIEPCLFFKYTKDGAMNFANHILNLLEVN